MTVLTNNNQKGTDFAADPPCSLYNNIMNFNSGLFV